MPNQTTAPAPTPHPLADHPPPPLQPTLGSTLLTHAEKTRTTQQHHPHLPLSTSCPALFDNEAVLLAGGFFRYNEITSLAGGPGTGKTLLAYQAIASHLLVERRDADDEEEQEEGGPAEAAVVDTTGGFSPVRLRDVLIFRLRARARARARQCRAGRGHSENGYGYGYEETGATVGGGRGGGEDDGVDDEATRLLDRVQLMRVFDFAGLVEAVGEVGEMREQCSGEAKSGGGRGGSGTVDGTAGARHEVEDSEGESDDEMLDEKPIHDDGEAREPAGQERRGSGEGGVGMIVIDSITNVASSVVSKSPIHGQALLASFMRSLQHLTSRYQLCTILINSAVGMNLSTLNPGYQRRPDDHVSIFSSSLGKPALGKAFTFLIDTSIFLSILPKTRDDAVIAYGGIADGRRWQKAIVLEVLKDRHGAREGRWMAFEIAGAVKLVPCFT